MNNLTAALYIALLAAVLAIELTPAPSPAARVKPACVAPVSAGHGWRAC